MSTNPLNNISRVYLEQVAVDEAQSLPPMERLKTDRDMFNIPKSERDAARERLLAKSKSKRKQMNAEALDPVGQEDADIDNDGDTDKSDKYLRNRRKAIGKAIDKKTVKEGFSNWREDLSEVMDAVNKNEKEEKIVEKTVKNKIKINPNIAEAVENLGGILLEMVELDEIDIEEKVDVASEYFYELGLNEYGVDILIEELGIEQFVDFVYEIYEECTLSESRTLIGKKKTPATGKDRGVSLKAAPGKTTKSAVEKYGTTRKLSSASSSTIKKKKVAVKNAIEKQTKTKATPSQTKTGIAGRVGAALGTIVKKGKEDIKRVQDAAQTARNVAARRGAEAKAVYDAVRERGKAAEQSAQATRARRKAKVAAGRAAQAAAPVVKKAVKAGAAAAGAGAGSLKSGKSPAAAAGKAAGTFVRKMTKEELELQEKAESEQQQKLFGLALSVKRGQTSRSEVSDAVLKIVDGMSEKEIRKFAETKHEGLPKKVETKEEAIKDALIDIMTKKISEQTLELTKPQSAEQPNQQEKKLQQQKISAQRKTLATKALELSAQKAQLSKGIPLQTQSYELEGEMIGEKNADIEAKFKKAKTPYLLSKFKQEHPGSRQPKKVPGAKETPEQRQSRLVNRQVARAVKHGLTSKEKGETQARSKYYSARD